jgi:hypothetical protein
MMSFEECQEWGKKVKEEKEELNKKMVRIRENELRKMGINPDNQRVIKQKYDHPSMPEDGAVTFLYLVCMIGSLIFKDFWIPWFILTVLYGKFITRHDND